jgi:hypothetical protein
LNQGLKALHKAHLWLGEDEVRGRPLRLGLNG